MSLFNANDSDAFGVGKLHEERDYMAQMSTDNQAKNSEALTKVKETVIKAEDS